MPWQGPPARAALDRAFRMTPCRRPDGSSGGPQLCWGVYAVGPGRRPYGPDRSSGGATAASPPPLVRYVRTYGPVGFDRDSVGPRASSGRLRRRPCRTRRARKGLRRAPSKLGARTLRTHRGRSRWGVYAVGPGRRPYVP